MIWYDFLQIPWWGLLIAILIGIVGSARLTRILVHDDYPPIVRLRVWWDKVTEDGPWSKLVHCLWCAGPWIFAATVASFLLSFLNPVLGWAWWIFYAWMAGSYLVSMWVYWDEGKHE